MAGLSPDILVLVALVVLLASTVRSTLGFGDGLVALPLLVALVGPTVAVPVVSAIGAGLGLSVGWSNRRSVDWGSAGVLLAGAVVGLPLGVWALTMAPVELLKRVLGCVLLLVAGHGVLQRSSIAWAGRRSAPLFGACAGVLSGMLGTSGPPLVVWSAGTGWPPDRIRATLQGVFLPLSAATVLGHAAAGLWRAETLTAVAVGAPAVLLGTALGNRLAPRIPAARFQKVLLVALGLLGSGMLVSA